jgi:hypothetical protein
MVARAGGGGEIQLFLFISHILRHACGFKLSNDGHDTRAIISVTEPILSTVRYTALTPNARCK